MGNECCCSEDKAGFTVESDTNYPNPVKEQPSDVNYWTMTEEHASRSATTRIDPYDGHVYTFATLAQKYTGTYSEAEINAYWENECWPVYDNDHPDELSSTCEFTIKLKKQVASEMLGIGLRKTSVHHQVVVKKPRGEALRQWHQLNPSRIVRDGDEIIAVNGKYGDPDCLINELTAGNQVDIEITLRRQTTVTVDLTLSGPLGLHLEPDTLAVKQISYGVLSARNQTCKPSEEILEGDILVEVNGMQAQWYDLLGEMANLNPDESQHVHLVFTRPGIE